MSAEAYFLCAVVMVLLWLVGVFAMARDIWRTRAGVQIGRRRFKMHLLLSIIVGPIGLYGALVVIEPVLPFWGADVLIYVTTMLLVAAFQFVLLIISSRRRERAND